MKKEKEDRKSKKVTTREQESQKEFETMSQQQNRYGKGRQQSGSDGSDIKRRGSNHQLKQHH